MDGALKLQEFSELTDEIWNILSECVGGEATREKVAAVYALKENTLFGVVLEKKCVGVVGVQFCDEAMEILHIAIKKELRKKGIGSLVLDMLLARSESKKFTAETDGDSVGFYLKNGFASEGFISRWGNIRYKVQKQF